MCAVKTQKHTVQDLALSPAQMLYGRPIRELKPGLFQQSEVWVTARDQRELAFRQRISQGGERWNEHTKPFPDLEPGQNVFIQNQQGAGKLSKRWDRTGLVIENDGHDKYTIKVDGSGRVVQRNRRYLRGFEPMELRQPGTRTPLPEVKIHTELRTPHRITSKPEQGEEVQMEPLDPVPNLPEELVVQESDPVVRRSTRVTRPGTKYPRQSLI